jgi:hypothetical protein
MDITDIKIFRIDFHQSSVDTIDQAEFPADFTTYLEGLINLMTSGVSGRTFRFDRDTTEVRGQLGEIMEGNDFSVIATTIATRLLSIEQKAQEQIAHMGTEIQKGIIVQALINDNDVSKFVICKADHNEFLNEISFTLSRGLPIKKKIFKGFICSLNSNKTLSDNLVYDQQLTKYWWNDFLELTKVHSDEDNTQNAFDAIDKSVLIKLKSKHPQDYMHLSNSNIQYFRGNENFDMNNYIASMFDNYLPFDDTLDMEKVKKEVRDLPTKSKKQFDEQFPIIKKQIKKRFIKDVSLTPQIELHFKEEIPDLENVVTAVIDDDGTKYVRVKSEQGYKYFNNLKNRGN